MRAGCRHVARRSGRRAEVAWLMLGASGLTTLGAIAPFLLGAQAVLVMDELGLGPARLGVAVSVFFAVAATVKVEGGTITTTLGPGQEDVARAAADLLPRYCKFTVQGKSRNFRASVLVRDETVGAISALPAF